MINNLIEIEIIEGALKLLRELRLDPSLLLCLLFLLFTLL